MADHQPHSATVNLNTGCHLQNSQTCQNVFFLTNQFLQLFYVIDKNTAILMKNLRKLELKSVPFYLSIHSYDRSVELAEKKLALYISLCMGRRVKEILHLTYVHTTNMHMICHIQCKIALNYVFTYIICNLYMYIGKFCEKYT